MARARKAKSTAKTKEVSAAIKTFKASEEVEEFYRFIHENGLRAEASTLIKLVLKKMGGTKRKKRVLH